jgi:sulfite reductase beta subunit-like hemoprotein
MNTKKMRRPVLLAVAASAVFAVGACETKPDMKDQTTAAPNTAPTTKPAIEPEVANPTEAALQKMLGRWEGPEGTYINITDKKGPDGKQQYPRKFEIEIKNLDKVEKFEGTAKGKDIEFTRNGKTETVKTATGPETGMKWLEKEANCLVVTKGSEGFCKKAETTAPAASPAASPASSPAASPANK